MKRYRLLSIATLATALMFLAPLQAEAAPVKQYVSLGDSIAVGRAAPGGQGFADLFAAWLGGEYQFLDLAHDGMTSADLLNQLRYDEGTRGAVREGEIVTVSIGGNNLLQPILNALYQSNGGLTAQGGEFSYEQYLLMMEQMAAMVNAMGPEAFADFGGELAGGALQTELQAGMEQFLSDFPQIMKEIRTLAPNAKVYVLTLYNPLVRTPELALAYSKLIVPMNGAIRLQQVRYGNVKAIPVDLLFLASPRALSLNLSILPPNVTAQSIDPHPTAYGQKLIYQNLILTARR